MKKVLLAVFALTCTHTALIVANMNGTPNSNEPIDYSKLELKEIITEIGKNPQIIKQLSGAALCKQATPILDKIIPKLQAIAEEQPDPLESLAEYIDATNYNLTLYLGRLAIFMRLTDQFADWKNQKPLGFFADQYMALCVDKQGNLLFAQLKPFYEAMLKLKYATLPITDVLPVILELTEAVQSMKPDKTGSTDDMSIMLQVMPTLNALKAKYLGNTNALTELLNLLVYRTELNRLAINAAQPRSYQRRVKSEGAL